MLLLLLMVMWAFSLVGTVDDSYDWRPSEHNWPGLEHWRLRLQRHRNGQWRRGQRAISATDHCPGLHQHVGDERAGLCAAHNSRRRLGNRNSEYNPRHRYWSKHSKYCTKQQFCFRHRWCLKYIKWYFRQQMLVQTRQVSLQM